LVAIVVGGLGSSHEPKILHPKLLKGTLCDTDLTPEDLEKPLGR